MEITNNLDFHVWKSVFVEGVIVISGIEIEKSFFIWSVFQFNEEIGFLIRKNFEFILWGQVVFLYQFVDGRFIFEVKRGFTMGLLLLEFFEPLDSLFLFDLCQWLNTLKHICCQTQIYWWAHNLLWQWAFSLWLIKIGLRRTFLLFIQCYLPVLSGLLYQFLSLFVLYHCVSLLSS